MRKSAKHHSICTDDKIEATVQFNHDLSKNTADFLCGDYTEESDKCSQLPKTPDKRRNQLRTKSFLLPIIAIFESFPDI